MELYHTHSVAKRPKGQVVCIDVHSQHNDRLHIEMALYNTTDPKTSRTKSLINNSVIVFGRCSEAQDLIGLFQDWLTSIMLHRTGKAVAKPKCKIHHGSDVEIESPLLSALKVDERNNRNVVIAKECVREQASGVAKLPIAQLLNLAPGEPVTCVSVKVLHRAVARFEKYEEPVSC